MPSKPSILITSKYFIKQYDSIYTNNREESEPKVRYDLYIAFKLGYSIESEIMPIAWLIYEY